MTSIGQANTDQLTRLLRALEWSDGFKLVLVVANAGPVRDEVLRRLAARGRALPGRELNLVQLRRDERLYARLKSSAADRRPRIVIVTGLDEEREDAQVVDEFGELNLHRDELPELVPGPLVLVLSERSAGRLLETAPDLYSWRSYIAPFAPGLESVTAQVRGHGSSETPGDAAEVERLTAVVDAIRDRRPIDAASLASALLRRAREARRLYRYAEASLDANEALALFEKLGAAEGRADALFWLGDIALARSDHESARRRFDEALPLYEEAGVLLGRANCIQRLGDIALERSDHDGARQRFEEALRLFGQVGEVLGRANCIQRLGDIALARSDHDGARRRYEEALSLYDKFGDVLGQANCIMSLGNIALRRSDHDDARQRYEEALRRYDQLGDVLGRANCIINLGEIALRRSDYDGARRRYEEALPLYGQVDDMLGRANCIHRLGDIAQRRSDHDGARRHYEEALPLYRQVGDVLGRANCIQRLGDIAFERSDHGGARRRCEEALRLYAQVGDVLGQANCIQRLGDIALERSNHDDARRCYEEALELYRIIPEPYSIGWTHLRRAKVAATPTEAQHHRESCIAAWKSIGREDLIRDNAAALGLSPPAP